MTLVDGLTLAAVALGHAALTVLTINVAHGLGIAEGRIHWLNRAVGAAALALPAAILACALNGPWSTWPVPLQAYAALCVAVGLVGLPVSTAVVRLRPNPPQARRRSVEPVDLAGDDRDPPPVGDGHGAWMLRLPGNESLRLCKSEWELTLPGLPRALDGLSLVQVTDLHFAPCYDRRYFDAVADQAAAWDADLVVVTGDLVDHDDSVAWIAPVLGRLRGRHGQFSILGNHDYIHAPDRVRDALVEAGYVDLEGRWDRLDLADATLAIGGTSYPWGPLPEPAAIPADADFRLLLSHSPDLFHRAAGWGVDLMLSGHNHGGQIRLPLVGPVFMPSRYSRRYDRGAYRSGKTLLYVSQGVGGKHPVRYNCPPEITRLILRIPEPQAARPTFSRARWASLPRN